MGMLETKVAFITGAASGIGAGTARRFAQEGAYVAIADVQVEDGARLRAEIEAAGGQALSLECDVSAPASVEQADHRDDGALWPAGHRFRQRGHQWRVDAD